MKIAPTQRQDLDFLRDTLASLEQIADRAGRPAFQALHQRLDHWAAKLAVIGQVKAGKSTFVNALLRQHDFLPSDVNPWTSVVTNIRLNLPGDPITGASFEFFGPEDWEEIVSGGSRIRDLTEQLLPGFDTDLLRKQSEEMRARAQDRLGKHYQSLLGSTHDYDFLTPDLLKRYVCAGPGTDEAFEHDNLGRYAALTKVANVYMRLPEYMVPTVITDTPGVNDPFLVRDEFTCRSLDKSDVFVMVLSAHQPLTHVDIALIRILAEQDEKDVVIFVNRIDELDDYASEVPRVMNDVATRLHGAIPHIDFYIVAGSAFLADLALRDETDPEAEALRAEMDTPELAAYVARQYGHVPGDRDTRLRLASGIDDLRATLSSVIDNGTGSQYLGQILSDVRAEINGAQFSARRERDSLQAQVESINSEAAARAVEGLETEIAKITAVSDDLREHIEATERQLEKIAARTWTKLQKQLIAGIESFIEEQKPVFEARLFNDRIRGDSGKALEIDVGLLQSRMEAEVKATYETSRAGTDVTLSNCLAACRQAIRDHFDDPTENITLDDLPHYSFNSTLTVSRRILRIDLITDRSWAFWKSPTVNIDKTLAALRTIAAAELRPAVENILAAFSEAQAERAAAGIGRLHVMQRMLETGLSERAHRVKKDRAELLRVAEDTDLQRRMVQRLQSQMEVLERRLLNFGAVDSALMRSETAKAA